MLLTKENDVKTMDKTQNIVIIRHTHLNETTCLYRSLKDKARSLSTLIEVDVSKETMYKVYDEQKRVAGVYTDVSNLVFECRYQSDYSERFGSHANAHVSHSEGTEYEFGRCVH